MFHYQQAEYMLHIRVIIHEIITCNRLLQLGSYVDWYTWCIIAIISILQGSYTTIVILDTKYNFDFIAVLI